jgi:quinol-cytochrome oxidoreductase complex cytochrome b subunit
VGTEIAGTVPIIGPFIVRVLRGGTDLSAVTLARFFSAHIWIFPAVISLAIGIHMYLVIRIGIAGTPEEDD